MLGTLVDFGAVSTMFNAEYPAIVTVAVGVVAVTVTLGILFRMIRRFAK